MDLLTLQIVPVVEEVKVPAELIDESIESVTIEQADETTTNE